MSFLLSVAILASVLSSKSGVFFLVSLYAYLSKTGVLVLGWWTVFFGGDGELILFHFK